MTPPGRVRLRPMGIGRELGKKFLGRASGLDRFLAWVNGINGTFYLAACANGWIDEDIAEMEAEETSMAERDFTGPDFTAWVHDLRRPGDWGPQGVV